VYLGLGLVWVFWVAGVRVFGATGLGSGWWGTTSGGAAALVVSAAALTVTWALLFGLVDDVFGTPADKGFRGHLAALAHGRLSTGGLKLFGIGFVALAGGMTIAGRAAVTGFEIPIVVIAATLVIALSANLVNLLDLRPGRALKGYVLMCVFAVFAIAIPATGGAVTALLKAVVLLIWLMGPALAVYRYDVREDGMLGDAGANAAGALAGFVLAWGLSTPALVVAAALLLAINLLSEKVSFSGIIESNSLLSRIDTWGRIDSTRSEAPNRTN
jgi:hypothetical protein